VELTQFKAKSPELAPKRFAGKDNVETNFNQYNNPISYYSESRFI